MMTLTLRHGLKFRALENDNKVRAEIIAEYTEAPTHVTIRNWALKIGYYELTRPKEKANDWIILLDHSIQFGQDKIFVVLGIREKDFIKLQRPLKYSDMKTLHIEAMKKSNGYLIHKILIKLETELGGFKYAVGDYGGDLKKGLGFAEITHVHDLSHSISNEIQKIYKSDLRYDTLKKELSIMRTKLSQTDIAAISPPKRRKKSEYQSFDTIVKWTEKCLRLLNILSFPGNSKQKDDLRKSIEGEVGDDFFDKIKANLEWIKDYRELITELSEINNAIKSIEKDMKHNGLSLMTVKKAKVFLAELTTEKGIELKDNLVVKLQSQLDLFSTEEIILCSSDILESTFGKYKNRVSENLMASVTVLILMIAAYSSSLEIKDIKESMENVKINGIKKWANDKVGISTHKMRTILLAV